MARCFYPANIGAHLFIFSLSHHSCEKPTGKRDRQGEKEEAYPKPSSELSVRVEVLLFEVQHSDSQVFRSVMVVSGVRGRDRPQAASPSTIRRTAVQATRGGQADQKSTDIAAVTL